jgi:hypothetical protein
VGAGRVNLQRSAEAKELHKIEFNILKGGATSSQVKCILVPSNESLQLPKQTIAWQPTRETLPDVKHEAVPRPPWSPNFTMKNDDYDDDVLSDISDTYINHLHFTTVLVILGNLSPSTNIITANK